MINILNKSLYNKLVLVNKLVNKTYEKTEFISFPYEFLISFYKKNLL